MQTIHVQDEAQKVTFFVFGLFLVTIYKDLSMYDMHGLFLGSTINY